MIDTRHFRRHVGTVALFTAIAIVVLLALFRLSGALSVGGSYDVKALVPQAGTLSQGVSVTMAGARVGTVTGVHRRGVGALVDIRIDDKSVRPLSRDSKAALAVRTPLGENYVELIPGRSKAALKSGDLIPPAPGDEYVDVDQILSILQGKTRDRARALIGGLGATVDGRGPQLQSTLRSTAGVLEGGSGLTARLNGDREQIGQLVKQLGDIGYAIGERGASVRQLARQGTVTFRAIAQRDAAVRSLLAVLPPTLRQVKETTGTLRSTSDVAAPVVANLAVALRQVRPAVRQLAPAAKEGRGVVDRLGAAAPKLEATLASARRASGPLATALPQVKQVFCETNPALRYLRPYVPDFVSFVVGLGAAANSYDAIGHTIRLMPVVGENATLGLPENIANAGFKLAHTGLFEGATALSFKPFPKPGEANDVLHPGDPMISGPAQVRSTGYVYPHITADC